MSDGQTIILHGNRETAHRVIDCAPVGSVVNVKPPRRSLSQNDKLHAMVTEVARARPEGRRYSIRVWKVMFMSMIGRQVTFEQGLDGEGMVPIAPSTSRLTKAECSELIEAIYAYGARHGVQFQEVA